MTCIRGIELKVLFSLFPIGSIWVESSLNQSVWTGSNALGTSHTAIVGNTDMLLNAKNSLVFRNIERKIGSQRKILSNFPHWRLLIHNHKQANFMKWKTIMWTKTYRRNKHSTAAKMKENSRQTFSRIRIE